LTAFSLPPLTVEVADGDIARQSADAVVNAANTELWMGAGVAGAIKAAGGAQIEADAMAQGPIGLGECVVTTFGRVAIPRFVIHAAVMGQDLRTSGTVIDRATRNALRAAEELEIASVAFPALGTGVGGFPVRECGRIMLAAVRDHARHAVSLRLVRFVLFGVAPYREFAEVAGETFGRPLDGPPECPIST
jgi:O-acetyl-ADP-ribose deacetylase (regulator of RNase III)